MIERLKFINYIQAFILVSKLYKIYLFRRLVFLFEAPINWSFRAFYCFLLFIYFVFFLSMVDFIYFFNFSCNIALVLVY